MFAIANRHILFMFSIASNQPFSGLRFRVDIDALQMILRVLSMGDAKSLACHPASTIHRQLTPQQLVLAGVSEDMIRISVGIEHIDDIIHDVEQAIQASKK